MPSNIRTTSKIPFKNSLGIFWLSPKTFEEIEKQSKYYLFLFIKGNFFIENRIIFAQETEMHVHKNG